MSDDKFEVVRLGMDAPDYFQGFGLAFSRFTNCVTGCGDTEREAFQDALEQAAEDDMPPEILEALAALAADFDDECSAHAEMVVDCQGEGEYMEDYPDMYFYVGIRW